MKKLLLILFFTLTSVVSFSQKETDVKIIDKGIYKVEYSEFFKNPVKVTYTIYKVKHDGVDRKGSFYKEPGVVTATNKDYENNPYDKGHMASAETFSDTDEHMHLTFSYVNSALQYYKLNRGTWKTLEFKEREWSQTDTLRVTNTVLFTKTDGKYLTAGGGAVIPSGFRKEIYFVNAKKKMVFEFPNQECDKNIYLYERKDLE